MDNKIILIITATIILTFAASESFAVEQKYIDLMDSYYKNVSDQILDTEHIALSNYVNYINGTLQ